MITPPKPIPQLDAYFAQFAPKVQYTEESTLRSIEFDSLDTLELITELESELGCEVDVEALLTEESTVGAIREACHQALLRKP